MKIIRSFDSPSRWRTHVIRAVMRKTDETLYISSWGWRPWRALRMSLLTTSRPIKMFLSGCGEFVPEFSQHDNLTVIPVVQQHSKLLIDNNRVTTGSFNIAMTDGWFNHAIQFEDGELATKLRKRLDNLPLDRSVMEEMNWLAKLKQDGPIQTDRPKGR